MMTFRKLSAASKGSLLRAYFTENTPEPIHDPGLAAGQQLDAGGRLTAYYTGQDSRATWRPDMPLAAAQRELCPNLGDDGLRRAAYRGG